MNIKEITKDKTRTTDQATKELKWLDDQIKSFEQECRRLENEMAQETNKNIETALAFGPDTTPGHDVLKLEHNYKTKKASWAELQSIRPVAEKNLKAAQAYEKRQEAEKLRKEGERHQKKTNELLAKLEEHEGTKYVPFRDTRRPDVVESTDIQKEYKTPYSERLEIQANDLEKEALQLERQVGKDDQELVTA